jgi:hypothetical protein
MTGTAGREPRDGESLILGDQRRFLIVMADRSSRGWWFRARALDGSSELQGNTPMSWDDAVRAWRCDAPAADHDALARRDRQRRARRRPREEAGGANRP